MTTHLAHARLGIIIVKQPHCIDCASQQLFVNANWFTQTENTTGSGVIQSWLTNFKTCLFCFYVTVDHSHMWLVNRLKIIVNPWSSANVKASS